MCMFSRVFIPNTRDLTTCSVSNQYINKSADPAESLEIYIKMKVEFFSNRYEKVPFKYLEAMHRFWTIPKKIEWNSTDAICFGWYCCHFFVCRAIMCSISQRNQVFVLLCVIAKENSDIPVINRAATVAAAAAAACIHTCVLRTLITKIIWKCRSIWEARKVIGYHC